MKQGKMKMKAKLFLILLVTVVFVFGCVAQETSDSRDMTDNNIQDEQIQPEELDDELDEALDELEVVEE